VGSRVRRRDRERATTIGHQSRPVHRSGCANRARAPATSQDGRVTPEVAANLARGPSRVLCARDHRGARAAAELIELELSVDQRRGGSNRAAPSRERSDHPHAISSPCDTACEPTSARPRRSNDRAGTGEQCKAAETPRRSADQDHVSSLKQWFDCFRSDPKPGTRHQRHADHRITPCRISFAMSLSAYWWP
jgi:hypothetical protein